MTTLPIDFSEFPAVSKADWLKQVAKDLKDKPLDSLSWPVTPELVVSPLVHADDFPHPPAPLSSTLNTWEICEQVDATEITGANRQILEALEFGAEGLSLHLPQVLTPGELSPLLAGVYLDFVGLHLAGPGVDHNPGLFLAGLQQLAAPQNISTQQLRGSLAYDPSTTAPLVDWRYLADLLDFRRTNFPAFQIIGIRSHEDTPDVVAELTALLQRGHFYLQKLTERGIPAAEVAAAIHFSVSVGPQYFLEIAKIRAFKTLWLNVLKAWDAPLVYPTLEARLRPGAYTEDLYTNLVRGTTMAMSAILGGVDRLTVLPYATGREAQATYPPAFGRRIARNVQHLLKMESGFDRLPADVAAGSYYLETLTGQLSELVWQRFSA